MNVSTNEMLLAMRAPTSGWLAAVICALDEALLDHDFSEQHRDMLRSLLDAGIGLLTKGAQCALRPLALHRRKT